MLTHHEKENKKGKKIPIQLPRGFPEFPISVSWCGEPVCGGFAVPGDPSICVTS